MTTAKPFVLAAICVAALGCGDSTSGSLTGDVVVTMTMKSLPAQLSINKTTTPDNRLEYGWEAIFDLNGSGTIDQGDVTFSLLNFKPPGDREEIMPVDELQAGLWSYTSDTALNLETFVGIEITGNTITLAADRPDYRIFGDITASTGVTFRTITYDADSDTDYFDYVPARTTFQDLSATGQGTDPLDDVSDISNNGTQLFPWIDFTAVSLTVR